MDLASNLTFDHTILDSTQSVSECRTVQEAQHNAMSRRQRCCIKAKVSDDDDDNDENQYFFYLCF